MSSSSLKCRALAAPLVVVAVFIILAGNALARLGIEYQAVLGNPDGAVTDAASRTRYLIQRGQYALSYNDDTHQANWVSWSYSLSDDGSASRTDAWAVEELLPSGFLKIGTATFGTGWDRGHMCPSADRLKSTADNEFTFRMSNIIPQASQNNQGLWNNFESYCRSMAADGDEVLVISGPAQFTGSRLGNQMAVPGSVWKIAVEVPNATSATPANQRVTTGARVIALLTPNVNTGLGTWQSYITSVEAIEAVTGFNFFTALDPSVAIYLKNVVDTGNGPNSPTVLTTFHPTLGPPGTAVVLSGYNFGPSPSVAFNGTPAAVTAVGNNTVTVSVPAGASSGAITVTGPGGTDTSYEDFTVTTGSTPIITLSTESLVGLASVEGQPGASRVYAVTGSLLTAPVSLDAGGDFEISRDNVMFGPSASLTPGIDGAVSAQIYVRIKAGAPAGDVSGTVVHASTGAVARTLSLSGSVAISQPYLSLSSTSLTGFTAVQASAGGSKAYSVSGGNLTGSITVAASSGFEVSTDNVSFGPSRTLVPVSGALAAVPVFARVGAGPPVGAISGTLVHSGGGATSLNLAVSGSVLAQGVSETSTFVWDFAQATPTSGSLTTASMSAVSQGNNNGTTVMLTNSSPSGYAGASGGNNAGAAARTGALNTAAGGSAFFEFTVTPADGVTFTISDVSFGMRSTSTGPQAFAVRSSADNYSSDLAAGTLSNNSTWALRSNSLTAGGTAATSFRIYGFNGSGSATTGTANWRIDDLKVTVSAGVAPPATPVITSSTAATATANQPFTYQITALNSPSSFSASGLPAWLSLNPSTGSLTGTPPAPGTFTFLVAAANAGGEGSASVSVVVAPDPNAPVITSALTASGLVGVPLRYQVTANNAPSTYLASNLPAGLTIDPATGLISGNPVAAGVTNITITASNASGADSKVLVLTVRNPVLTVPTTGPGPFSANLGFASAAQSYTVTGADLSGPLSVSAPAGFEVSLDGIAFAEDVSVAPDAAGDVSAIVRLRLSALAGLGENAGSIIHASAGATPKYLAVTGSVIATAPTISLSVPGLTGFTSKTGAASFVQSYTVNGASLGGPVTVAASAGFELTTDGVSFATTAVLVPVNGRIAASEIGVRLAASAPVGDYTGSVTHSGGGAPSQTLSLTGAVQARTGPPITSLGSGSSYAGGSFSHTITAGGDLPVTGYGASGLPAGLSVNTTTGVISGSVAAAGAYAFSVSASNADGTTIAPYTLRVVSSAEQGAQPLSVTVNKFQNAATDRVELLVMGDSTDSAPGPPVDLRGMILKDFSSSMGSDLGGKFVFSDVALWASVRAGTLVVLSAGTASTEDLDPSDFVLRVNLGNPAMFVPAGGSFDIQNTDMVMVKPAGAGLAGVAGGIHALGVGNAGTQYLGFTGKRLRSSNSLGNNRSCAYVLNGNSTAADFYAAGGGQAASASSLTFGAGSTSGNTAFINSLRALDQTPPLVTLNGSAAVGLVVGSSYAEPGATAVDAVDGPRTVTIAGAVNTAVAGVYSLVYSATDLSGNRGTATRTVTVSAPAAPVVSVSGTPSGLQTIYGTPSSPTSFTISASNLVAPVTVTAPEGFEVALQAAGSYVPSLDVGSSGTLASTTVHVRLSGTSAAGLYAGTVSLSTTGGTDAFAHLPSSLIELKPVTVSGLAGQDKIYDGSAVAVVSGTPVIDGVLARDVGQVGLGGAPSFLFADAGSGTAKPITAAGFTLVGAAASNYVLTQPSGLAASIVPAALGAFAVTFTAQPAGGLVAEAPGVAGFAYSYAGRDPTDYAASAVPPAAPGLYTVTATSSDPNVTGSASHDYFIAGLVLAPDTLVRASGAQSVDVDAADLLANDRWIDGTGTFRSDGLAVLSVSGTGASLEDGVVSFVPGAPEGGSFTYVAGADGLNAEAAATVSLQAPFSLRFLGKGAPVFAPQAGSTTVTHLLAAPAGASFEIEYATDLAGPWTSAGAFTNDSTEEFEVTVSVPGDQIGSLQRGMFFRARTAVP